MFFLEILNKCILLLLLVSIVVIIFFVIDLYLFVMLVIVNDL